MYIFLMVRIGRLFFKWIECILFVLLLFTFITKKAHNKLVIKWSFVWIKLLFSRTTTTTTCWRWFCSLFLATISKGPFYELLCANSLNFFSFNTNRLMFLSSKWSIDRECKMSWLFWLKDELVTRTFSHCQPAHKTGNQQQLYSFFLELSTTTSKENSWLNNPAVQWSTD